MIFRFSNTIVTITALALVAMAVALLPHQVLRGEAASTTGVVTGQIVWRAAQAVPYAAPGQSIPDMPSEMLPGAAPDMSYGSTPEAQFGWGEESGATDGGPDYSGSGEASPETGGQAMPVPDVQAMPDPRAYPIRPRYPRTAYIPAGAVLVALQGTGISARTDEKGRFRLEGVPAGEFLTVAAGPVQGISTAFVIRPNVLVRDGQTVDLGRLYLGQYYSAGPLPYGSATAPSEVQPEDDGQ